jgi:TRAP-type C4-dicarboxylate transport system permease small subunit
MIETTANTPRPRDPIGRVLFACAYLFALLGGLLMTAIAVMVVVSVLGRWLILAPIPGDFEMVAIGTAVAVFLFLPYCHMIRGNVIVDLFLAWAPVKVRTFFDMASGLLLAVIAAALAWRTSLGGLDMYKYSETSYIVGIPLWPAFPVAVASFALLAAACLYTSARDLKGLFE